MTTSSTSESESASDIQEYAWDSSERSDEDVSLSSTTSSGDGGSDSSATSDSSSNDDSDSSSDDDSSSSSSSDDSDSSSSSSEEDSSDDDATPAAPAALGEYAQSLVDAPLVIAELLREMPELRQELIADLPQDKWLNVLFGRRGVPPIREWLSARARILLDRFGAEAEGAAERMGLWDGLSAAASARQRVPEDQRFSAWQQARFAFLAAADVARADLCSGI